MDEVIEHDAPETTAEIRIGGHRIRVVVSGLVPAGFALFCNHTGWAAFQRGEQPKECDAALLKMDTPSGKDGGVG